MKYYLLTFSVLFSCAVWSGGSTGNEEQARSSEEITIVYAGYPSGKTRLILNIDEDTREASLEIDKGKRVNLIDIADDIPSPPATTLDKVRANFEDETLSPLGTIAIFDKHVGRLRDGLVVPPGFPLEKVHDYINLELAKILGDYAEPHWLPWTNELMGKLTVEGIDLETYTNIINSTREGLGE